MKSKLQSLAVLLILIFLVFAAISLYYGKDFSDRAVVAEAKLAKTQLDLDNLTKVQLTVATLIGPVDPYANQPATYIVAEFAELINKLQFNRGVKIEGIVSLDQNMTVGTLKSVPSTADGLKYIDLKITGSYKSYVGFLEYVDLLHTLPVAITKIDAKGKQFEINIHVFGV